MRIRLQHERLNKAGYDSTGVYYGVGPRMYRAFDEHGRTLLRFRAPDREEAKRYVKDRYYADAVFYG